jgi:lipoate-protein ligase A
MPTRPLDSTLPPLAISELEVADPAPTPTALPRRWLSLATPAAPGAYNMAVDEALMAAAVAHDRWIVRIYSWANPTISFGRHQGAARAYSRDVIAARGIEAVRRPTGGRAILHHREITYSVAAPLSAAGDLRQSYRAINDLLVDALRRLGVPASCWANPVREVAPGSMPCFDHPSEGELVVDGRKLVGSAQWRSHDALLQHGSILIDDDQPLLGELLLPDVAVASAPPAATLREILGTIPTQVDVAEAFAAAIQASGGALEPCSTPLIDDASLRPLIERYESEQWTWQR